MPAVVPGSSTGIKFKSLLLIFRKYFKTQNMFVAIIKLVTQRKTMYVNWRGKLPLSTPASARMAFVF